MQFMKRDNDRRSKCRFTIERDVRYKMVDEGIVVASGVGQTTNMCSAGVAFSTERSLTAGAFIELSISWPVLLDETCPMRLIVFGRILRCTGRKAVCTIDKYEFRTQARTVQTTPAIRADTMLQRWADGMRKENLKASMVSA
jgi:hypothetical protein